MPVLTIQPLNDTDGFDTFVQDGSDADTNFGGEAFLQLGYRTATNKNARLLFKFDISSIPGNAVISSAILSFYTASVDEDESNNNSFDVARITADWNEGTVTWNNQPATATKESSTTINGGGGSFVAKYYDFTVTQMVTEWYNGVNNNFGMKVYNPTTGLKPHFNVNGSGSGSNQPKLVVTYEVKQFNRFYFM